MNRMLSRGLSCDFLWFYLVIVFSVVNVGCPTAGIGNDYSEYTDDGFPLYKLSEEFHRKTEIHNFLKDARSRRDFVVQWDKSKMSVKWFHIAYCSKVCFGQQIGSLLMDSMCLSTICFPCTCDKPRCQYYGTCCPDYTTLFPASSSSDEASINSPDNPRQHSPGSIKMDTFMQSSTDKVMDIKLGCDKLTRSGSLYIRFCPSNYSEGHVRASCEVDIPADEQVPGTFLRVTDTVTGVTYYNQYCAICNGVTDFVTWTLAVVCMNFMEVYTARTPDEFLRMSSSVPSCFVNQEAQAGQPLHECDEVLLGAAVVDSCNVTGEWGVYDEDVERACGELPGVQRRVRDKGVLNITYKNLFCKLCNTKYLIMNTECNFSVEPITQNELELPFSLLLNFGPRDREPDSEKSFTNCSQETEWTSPNNLCLPLTCTPGKILINGTCSTAIDQIRGLLYRLQVVYLPKISVKTARSSDNEDLDIAYNLESYLPQFKLKVEKRFSKVVQDFDTKITVTDRSQGMMTPAQGVTESSHLYVTDQIKKSWFTLNGFLLANRSLSRDKVERYLVKEFLAKSFYFSMGSKKMLTLTPMLVPDRCSKPFECKSVYKKVPCDELLLKKSDGVISHLEKEPAIFVDPLLTCPFVIFNFTQFLYDSNSSSFAINHSVILLVDGVSVVIYKKKELNLLSIAKDGTLKICKELLTSKFHSFYQTTDGTITMMFQSQYFLTLVCLSASILCLAATLITYSLLPVLRSVAGKNNMFLCGSLLLAQSSLLATSHVQPNSQLCTFFAISTHFLWLSMFCWCFTCCLHMFLTFSSKTRSVQTTASSERKYMIKRLVACSVVPALVVITVIVVNYFTSQGRVIGYGQTTCFLDSPTLVGTALVTPLCLVLICNVYFFSATIYKINNILKLQSGNFKKEDKNNLYIYVKLSSVTGLFWIASIISEATNNDPLRFIAISLNGLQGVFIFLSYICNKRVLKLYVQCLGSEKTTPTSTLNKIQISKKVSNKIQRD